MYFVAPSWKKSDGSVLAISLVLLTAITLLALSSMQRSGLQTKMAGQVQRYENCFHAVESAHEFWLQNYKDSAASSELLTLLKNNQSTSSLSPNSSNIGSLPYSTANDPIAVTGTLTYKITATTSLPGEERSTQVKLIEGAQAGSSTEDEYIIELSACGGVINKIERQRLGFKRPSLNTTTNSFF